MSNKIVPDLLHRRWIHSHEEDTATEIVYRPATFNFPRSRGRKGFELKPDGTLADVGIGPTDRPSETTGTWRIEHDKIACYRAAESTPFRVMQIASVDEDHLVVTK
jgi:hypothetical protein